MEVDDRGISPGGADMTRWPADVWLPEGLAGELDGDTDVETVRYVKATTVQDIIIALAATPIPEEALAMLDDGAGLAKPRDILHIGFAACIFELMLIARGSGL